MTDVEAQVAQFGESFQHAGIVEKPLWLYLLLGAVMVLLGEWYLWCRDF